MTDLRTRYLGLDLPNPIVVSSGPISRTVDGIRSVEDAGAAAVIMYSMFEEQLHQEAQEAEAILSQGTHSFAEALDYLPDPDIFVHDADAYLEHLRRSVDTVDIPVIASLNGTTPGGWVRYAGQMQEAGAAAIELNLYALPTDMDRSSAEVEEDLLTVLREVKDSVSVPVAVKISPFFSNIPNMCRRLVEGGADGLVLFNRFYQPDIDLEELEVVPNLHLSTSHDLRLPLRWIAILRGRVQADLAATGGVHSATDALKVLMAGADVSMMMAALLLNGVEYVKVVLHEMREWLESHEYESIDQLKGSMSHRSIADPGLFERANYMRGLNLFLRP